MSMEPTRARPDLSGSHPHADAEAAPHTSRIESLGVCLPEHRLSTRELLASCRRRFKVDLERLTGIRERRVCRDGEDSYTLAVDAAWDCLAHSKHDAQDIEMLISCSITKYNSELSFRFEPPLSLGIKEAVGASRALNFDISNACAGMMTGVAILDDFIRRGVVRRGMVVSGEYITSISDNATRSVRTILSKQLASLTVGDAGAAVILERAERSRPGIRACEFVTVADHSDLCIGKACPTAPGAAMSTKPRKLHSVAIRSAIPVIERALSRSGVPFDQVAVIPHQTSVRAIRAGLHQYRSEIGTEPRDLVYNLELFGNTASTTHFVALKKCLEEGRFQAGEHVLLICYASGLVVGAIVFTLDELVEAYGRNH